MKYANELRSKHEEKLRYVIKYYSYNRVDFIWKQQIKII